MLKRLLVRLLSPSINIDFESALRVYVNRTDIWKGDIPEERIRTIVIENNIRLKHTFIILERLEEEQNEKILSTNPKGSMNSH